MKLLTTAALLLTTTAAHAQTPSIPRGGSGVVPYQTTATRNTARYKWRIVYSNPRAGIKNQIIASSANPRDWNAANLDNNLGSVRVPATAKASGKYGWYRLDMHLGPARGRVYGLGLFFVY